MTTPILDAMLARFALKPCACGKRRCGDQQELVGELKIAHSQDAGDFGLTRVSGQFKCQVCGDVHKGCYFMPLEPGAIT